MDGSGFGGRRAVPLVFPPREEPGVPEREWGLSAGQVTGVVLVIVAVCEVVGWLG